MPTAKEKQQSCRIPQDLVQDTLKLVKVYKGVWEEYGSGKGTGNPNIAEANGEPDESERNEETRQDSGPGSDIQACLGTASVEEVMACFYDGNEWSGWASGWSEACKRPRTAVTETDEENEEDEEDIDLL